MNFKAIPQLFKKLVLPASLSICLFPVSAWSDQYYKPSEKSSSSSNQIFQLSKLVNEVLSSNPEIQTIEAELEAVTAKADAADRPLYNPELQLDDEKTSVRTSSLGISQTIDWSDKRGARSQAARFDKSRFTAKLEVARQRVIAKLLQALANYQTGKDINELAKHRVELLQGFVELAGKRRDSGDLSQAELSLAELAFADANIKEGRATSRLIEMRQVLISIVGNENRDWPDLPDALPQLNLTDEKLGEILTKLPLIQEQLSRISAARANISLRSRERSPDPTIGVRGGREDSESLVGVSISIPIFVRNNFRAEVGVANAELIKAEREKENVLRTARSKLFSSSRRYKLVRQTWLTWQESGKASLSEQIDLIQQLWQVGEISTTEYFMQLNQTLDMRLSAIELRHDLWFNWIDWLLASNRIGFWLDLNKQDYRLE